MNKNFLVLPVSLLAIALACAPAPAHAQSTGGLTVTPVVIDDKGKARDIVKETITVTNNASHTLELYPSVNDINAQTGEESFATADDAQSLQASLANWIELSRGMVDLSPGEQKSIPFVINVDPEAAPGTYHAQISLTEGDTRADADSKPPLGVVTVNFEVDANIISLLQLNKFTTGNIFFSGDDVLFNYELQNDGNQNLAPTGQIHIYNRQGNEVATLDVNKNGTSISPQQVEQLASVWSAANGFGQYKAMLTVDYGSDQTASVQDTVFFWIIPWKQMLIMFGVSLFTVVVLALYFHRWLERRHLYKFAHAGLLNDDTLKKIHHEDTPYEPAFVPPPPPEPKATAHPAPRAQEPTAHEHRSLREVLHKEPANTTHGHSIDLKQLHTQRAHAATVAAHGAAHTIHIPQAHKPDVQGHVISLKKRI